MNQSKIDDVLEQVENWRDDRQSIVMIYGDFNILHPGHFRLIRFAKEQGDKLIVGVFSKTYSKSAYLPDDERSNALAALNLIDGVVIVKHSLEEALRAIRPHHVVKGKEWRHKNNPEETLLGRLGCHLIFSSGERFTDSLPMMLKEHQQPNWLSPSLAKPFIHRHQLHLADILSLLKHFQKLRVAILGDIIVDTYQDCSPIGMSREDPTLVVMPQSLSRFLGGAGIVAAHAHSLGAKVDLYSVVGSDEPAQFTREKLKSYGVGAFLLCDGIRPTTVKLRYRASGKTLLRVNNFQEQDISSELQREFEDVFASHIENYDVVIFSDFSYGFLSPSVIHYVCQQCQMHDIPYVADSQSSSQVGDLNKFKHLLLATPTEHEARLATKNSQDGLVCIAERLIEQIDIQHLLITLGAEGVLIKNGTPCGEFEYDELPALNTNLSDPSGAGDAMLVATTMALICGANLWQSSFLGSIAAACQVGRVGNVPISNQELVLGAHALFTQ